MNGLKKYTIEEAQNIQLGQVGVAYLTSTGVKYTPPSGSAIVAIQFLENTSFDSADTTAEASWPTRAQVGCGTNGEVFAGAVFLAGMTIYGRWKTVGIDSGSIIIYVG
jgi:hypothetical protein